YVPTVYETDTPSFTLVGLEVELLVFDTAGQSDYDRPRATSYSDTDVFYIRFAIDNRGSLDNVLEKAWDDQMIHLPSCSHSGIIFLLSINNDFRVDAETILELPKIGAKPIS
ncbi:hypothetical protein B0T10DRAFT_384011, partial [Thelonectria olida]